MRDNVISVNDKAFNELIMKFYDIKEDLNEVFDALNSLVDSLEMCYDSESGRKLVDDYHTFRDANYGIMLENIESYVTDLKTARNNLEAFDAKVSMQIKEDTLTRTTGSN